MDNANIEQTEMYKLIEQEVNTRISRKIKEYKEDKHSHLPSRVLKIANFTASIETINGDVAQMAICKFSKDCENQDKIVNGKLERTSDVDLISTNGKKKYVCQLKMTKHINSTQRKKYIPALTKFCEDAQKAQPEFEWIPHIIGFKKHGKGKKNSGSELFNKAKYNPQGIVYNTWGSECGKLLGFDWDLMDNCFRKVTDLMYEKYDEWIKS